MKQICDLKTIEAHEIQIKVFVMFHNALLD